MFSTILPAYVVIWNGEMLCSPSTMANWLRPIS
jgi:hypothetical protein